MDYRAYYDEHAEYAGIRDRQSFEHWKYTNDVLHYKIKYLAEVCAGLKPSSILEVGCATGFLLANLPFATATSRVGVDLAPRNIDHARLVHPEIAFVCGTLPEFMKSQDRRFDLIILSDILEHVEDDEGLLSLCAQLGNHVAVNIPIEKCGENSTRAYGPSDREGHLRAYGVEDARRLVRRAGFEEICWTLKKYVNEQVFRQYLLAKLLRSKQDAGEAQLVYQQELFHIEHNQDFYKDNYFALLAPHQA
jgi:2-polyprenyl-3-methyl-5-hydroxy-6-metoxy-1,4-benzoquinol methylase